jgi:serine O-acetyltransferase
MDKATIGIIVMIAPNSYINFDVPANYICVGNPAKLILKENATQG